MKRWCGILSLLLAGWCAWVTPALAESPKDFVHGVLDQVIAIQTDPALADETHEAQRGRQIHQIIERSFDFPFMAKDTLADTTDQISPGQRQEFLNLFSYLFQDSYTRLVLKFLRKENITYHREILQDNQARVETSIVRPNEFIPVTYLMHRAGAGWLLFDVNVDGVSILDNYRTQFAQVIRTKGFSFLLERLKTQRQSIK